eukprot:TRINITY_DN11752_c0_g1_i5.p1 TRINITY_DN11752_c0_g1~~TRINITY_DN11752_c0_g1_i5.p1  ORF type:complete len:313 (-),score=53.53 TRINITY_DN11752_c0_g1_i5:126-1064(-)
MTMYRLYAHPNSYSSWVAQVMLKELSLEYSLHNVDLFKGEQFEPDYLRLSPGGVVPALVVAGEDQHQESTTIIGLSEIRKHLAERCPDHSIFTGETERYLSKLEEAPVGLITFGLAFHKDYTKILRYPFHEPDFTEKSKKYVLERGNLLQNAIAQCDDPSITTSLLNAAEKHYQNAEHYLNPDKYSCALGSVSSLLDWFETDLAREGRIGIWLGGIQCNVADIVLGMLLHRIWQLGLENTMFKEGTRPHLTLFYDRIRERPTIKNVTQWDVTASLVNVIKSDEDVFADQAKMGLGVMALLGGLYLGKKFLKK